MSAVRPTAGPPPRGLRQRWRAWWDARHPRSDTLELTQRNVYILPTRAGWMFALTLLVLLVASINYQLSLGYLLTFLLAGSGVVAMHVTHATLRGLALHLRPPAAVFAGDAAVVDCVLASTGARARHGIGLRFAPAGGEDDDALVRPWWRRLVRTDRTKPPPGGPPVSAPARSSWVDVPGGGQCGAQLSFLAGRRGVRRLPTIVLETRFPLGLFRAWSEWRPASSVLVYPRPERPAPPLPAARASGTGSAAAGRASDGGEVEGIRAYRRGDPLQRVVWKKAARALDAGGELVIRDTSSTARRELWLEWSGTGALAPEDRLSRLCAWLLACERAGDTHWGLRLPGAELAPAQGETHRLRALEALARQP